MLKKDWQWRLRKLCLVALMGIALSSCAGGSAAPTESSDQPATAPMTEAPGNVETPDYAEVQNFVVPENISISQLVFPEALSVEQKLQVVDTFRQAEPVALQNLEIRLTNYYPDLNTPLGVVSFNWDASSAAYIVDPDNNYQIDVLAVPVALSDPDAFSPDRLSTMIASGMLNELVVGGLLVRSDLEASLPKGDYLAIWHADINEVWLVNPETGETVQASYCETDISTFQPAFYLYEGSLGWCIKFDSRKCCV